MIFFILQLGFLTIKKSMIIIQNCHFLCVYAGGSEIEVMQKMTREELEYHQNNSIHSIILKLSDQ